MPFDSGARRGRAGEHQVGPGSSATRRFGAHGLLVKIDNPYAAAHLGTFAQFELARQRDSRGQDDALEANGPQTSVLPQRRIARRFGRLVRMSSSVAEIDCGGENRQP
jgi:hypothetical protein